MLYTLYIPYIQVIDCFVQPPRTDLSCALLDMVVSYPNEEGGSGAPFSGKTTSGVGFWAHYPLATTSHFCICSYSITSGAGKSFLV